MAFRTANLQALVKFNSDASRKFIQKYEGFVLRKIESEVSEPPHRTFAPSSFRCSRKQWFRLRGTQPDKVERPDVALNFSAEVGTARHKVIQQNLKEMLKDDWIEVEDYFKSTGLSFEYADKQSLPSKSKYILTKSDDRLETLVESTDIPVRFAVDGIIRIDGKIYLLEIKTSDHGAFAELTDPKPIHVDQVKCYCALLNLFNVLMVYEDRQYGDMKCYQVNFSSLDQIDVIEKMKDLQTMAQSNLAPERLPHGDYMCSNCEYKKKCKEWG